MFERLAIPLAAAQGLSESLSALHSCLFVGAALFGIGAVGFLARRNMIVMFICAEMMLQGVAVSLAAWSRHWNDWGGQALTIFILTAAACEAAIALALITLVFRRSGKLDIAFWQTLREEGQPAFVDRELPEESLDESRRWPRLTVAGRAPGASDDDEYYGRQSLAPLDHSRERKHV